MRRIKTQRTCPAVEACDESQLIDIFEENFGYLSIVSTFIQRRINDPNLFINDEIATSTKPLLVLDIDNTILFVRFFSDEIRVNDNIKYFENNEPMDGIITAVWYRLKLNLYDDDVIDELGTDMIEFDHCHIKKKRMKKGQHFDYPFKINENTAEILETRSCTIKDFRIIGCEIEFYDNFENATLNKYVSFEQNTSSPVGNNTSRADLDNFQPCLTRKNMQDVTFIYDGFLVRMRPNLEEFIEHVNEDWNVCFFTAANKTVYEGLMNQLHSYLSDIMAKEENERLWNKKIFYRQDCTFDYDDRGKIYHHKNLTKYGKDLSKVVMVDNSSLAFKALEPNSILIKDYFGKCMGAEDIELDNVSDILDDIIDEYRTEVLNEKYIDFRYILCNIQPMPTDLHLYDRGLNEDIEESTKRFLNDLKFHLLDNERLSNKLKFDEPKASPLSMSVSMTPFGDDDYLTFADLEQFENENRDEITNDETEITPKANEQQFLVDSKTKPVSLNSIARVKNSKSMRKFTYDATHVPSESEASLSSSSRTPFNISLSIACMPSKSNLTLVLPEEQKAFQDIMESPVMREKLQTMTESDLMQFSNDDELEMESHGCGSKEEDTEEDTEDELERFSSVDTDTEIDSDEKLMEIDRKLRSLFPNVKPSADELSFNSLSLNTNDKSHVRRFSMRPKPDQQQMQSGMSIVFLKVRYLFSFKI